jgi:hypothetical protein
MEDHRVEEIGGTSMGKFEKVQGKVTNNKAADSGLSRGMCPSLLLSLPSD